MNKMNDLASEDAQASTHFTQIGRWHLPKRVLSSFSLPAAAS